MKKNKQLQMSKRVKVFGIVVLLFLILFLIFSDGEEKTQNLQENKQSIVYTTEEKAKNILEKLSDEDYRKYIVVDSKEKLYLNLSYVEDYSYEKKYLLRKVVDILKSIKDSDYEVIKITIQGTTIDKFGNDSGVRPVLVAKYNGADINQINWDNEYLVNFEKIATSFLFIK